MTERKLAGTARHFEHPRRPKSSIRIELCGQLRLGAVEPFEGGLSAFRDIVTHAVSIDEENERSRGCRLPHPSGLAHHVQGNDNEPAARRRPGIGTDRVGEGRPIDREAPVIVAQNSVGREFAAWRYATHDYHDEQVNAESAAEPEGMAARVRPVPANHQPRNPPTVKNGPEKTGDEDQIESAHARGSATRVKAR